MFKRTKQLQRNLKNKADISTKITCGGDSLLLNNNMDIKHQYTPSDRRIPNILDGWNQQQNAELQLTVFK